MANFQEIGQTNNIFHQLPSIPKALRHSAGGFVNGHEIVVAGGYITKETMIFDIDTNQWRDGPDIPIVASSLTCINMAAVQYQGSFIIAGGIDWGSGILYANIFKFDPINYQWEVLPQSLSKARYFHSVLLVPNDFISCS